MAKAKVVSTKETKPTKVVKAETTTKKAAPKKVVKKVVKVENKPGSNKNF